MTPERSTTRRAAARRFSLPRDPAWERLQRAVIAGGLAAALAAVAVQASLFDDVWALPAVALSVALAAALPVRARSPDRLRWDGAQWWWQRAGEPLAISPQVFIDLEQWMLLRLDVADLPGRPRGRAARSRWLGVSRRRLGAQWAPLRLHLFLARGGRDARGEIRA